MSWRRGTHGLGRDLSIVLQLHQLVFGLIGRRRSALRPGAAHLSHVLASQTHGSEQSASSHNDRRARQRLRPAWSRRRSAQEPAGTVIDGTTARLGPGRCEMGYAEATQPKPHYDVCRFSSKDGLAGNDTGSGTLAIRASCSAMYIECSPGLWREAFIPFLRAVF